MPEWVNDELIIHLKIVQKSIHLVQFFLCLQSIIVSFQPYLSI